MIRLPQWSRKKVTRFEEEELGGGQEVKKDDIGEQTNQVQDLQLLLEGRTFFLGLSRDREIAECECEFFGKYLGCTYTPYCTGLQL